MPDEGWTTHPKINGWYEVEWAPGDVGVFYLHVTPPEQMAAYGIALTKNFVCWGDDETDDPEAVDLGSSDDQSFPRCRLTTPPVGRRDA